MDDMCFCGLTVLCSFYEAVQFGWVLTGMQYREVSLEIIVHSFASVKGPDFI